MVLISIHPFALRKLFLIIVASLGFSALCFADPVLMVRRYSVRPDSPKTAPQIASQSFDAFHEGVLGNAARPSEAGSSDLAGTMSAVCVLRSAVSAESPLAEAPVFELRKI